MPGPLRRVDKTEGRLQALEDRAAIADLIAAYGPLADNGDATGVAASWSEDGCYDVGGFGVAEGRAAIAALIESETHQALLAQGCAHMLSPHHITLSGDSAEAVGYSVVFRRSGDGYEAWRVSANRWQLVRTAAGWRVSRRINRPLDGSADARALLAATGETI